MNSNLLFLDIEASSGNGEDSHLICNDAYYEFSVFGVFDGLGGRSAGFDGIKGGRIASRQAFQTTERVLKQWNGRLNQDIAIELQSSICQALKSQAELKMGKSRLSGTLTGKRLCTTIAVASIPKKSAGAENGSCEVSLAWMGDSRVYFLSPQRGLQQLTTDDLEIDKDAFQMIREDPRMSQYLTADVSDDWQIHFAVEKLEEKGCILVCTDGCFQYLPTPWDFEKLLLETLTSAETLEKWQSLLAQRYEQIKQDDISLILSPLGFDADFPALSQAYQTRLEHITSHYCSTDANNVSLNELWESYRSDYEARLHKGLKPVVKEKVEAPVSSLSEGVDDDKVKPQSLHSDVKPERIEAQPKKGTQKEFSSDSSRSLTNEADYKEADSTEVRVQAVIKLFSQAEKDRNRSQLNNVVLDCQEILNDNPNNLEIKFILGKAHFCLNDFQDSISHFESIIAVQGNEYNQDCLRLIAEASHHVEDYLNSSHYFSRLKSISHYKFFNDCHLIFYARSLIKTHEFRLALEVCETALQRNSNPPYINLLKGLIYHECNHLYEAKQFLEKSEILYKQEFLRSRSEYLQRMIQYVHRECQIVHRKLDNQHPDSWGGY